MTASVMNACWDADGDGGQNGRDANASGWGTKGTASRGENDIDTPLATANDGDASEDRGRRGSDIDGLVLRLDVEGREVEEATAW